MIVPWRCIHKLATMGNDTATAPEIARWRIRSSCVRTQSRTLSLPPRPRSYMHFSKFCFGHLDYSAQFPAKVIQDIFLVVQERAIGGVSSHMWCSLQSGPQHGPSPYFDYKKPRVSKRTVSVLWFYVSCLYIGTKSDGERYCCECFCTDFRRQADKVRFEGLSSVVMDFWCTNGMRNNSGIGWTAGAKRIFVSGNYDCL